MGIFLYASNSLPISTIKNEYILVFIKQSIRNEEKQNMMAFLFSLQMLPNEWTTFLYEDFTWLAECTDNDSLRDIVNRVILTIEEDGPVSTVYESSTWAVCMLYLHYLDGDVLTTSEIQYARNRGGVIGMNTGNEIQTVTIKSYLYWRDPGFYAYVTKKRVAVGA